MRVLFEQDHGGLGLDKTQAKKAWMMGIRRLLGVERERERFFPQWSVRLAYWQFNMFHYPYSVVSG